jgi:hypothetical protein
MIMINTPIQKCGKLGEIMQILVLSGSRNRQGKTAQAIGAICKGIEKGQCGADGQHMGAGTLCNGWN